MSGGDAGKIRRRNILGKGKVKELNWEYAWSIQEQAGMLVWPWGREVAVGSCGTWGGLHVLFEMQWEAPRRIEEE